tara:strand:- start:1385 stop:1993 length:609 start_codon:yes stop_codon:yes gene_type:complete
MNLTQFKTNIKDVVYPNLFQARIAISQNLANKLSNEVDAQEFVNSFPFRCESANFTGKTIATTMNQGAGGLAFKTPTEVVYGTTDISVICSADMIERNFFEEWQNIIIGHPRRDADQRGLIEFYTNFAEGCDLTVSQFDASFQNVVYAERYYDVFPESLTPLSVAWESQNTYQRFGVTFAYRYYDAIIPEGRVEVGEIQFLD